MMISVDSLSRSELRQEVARLVAMALPNKQIAARLGITERQVKRVIGEIADEWQLDRTLSIRVQIASVELLRRVTRGT